MVPYPRGSSRPANRYLLRTLNTNFYIQKFKMYFLQVFLHPGKEQLRHSRVGFDIVIEKVVNGLVSPRLNPARPRTFHRFGGRRDDEEHEHRVTESAQQSAVGRLACPRLKAVEPEPVDQEMRKLRARRPNCRASST